MVQSILKSFGEEDRRFVFDELKACFLDLATNSVGLCVIKVLIARTFEKAQRQELIDIMIP